jgi:hypothetical protein
MLCQSVALQSFFSTLLCSIALRAASIARLHDSRKNLPQRSYPPKSGSSRPVAAAALAIPDLAASIFSAYCSGMRVDFHPPACVIAAKSMSISARSCAAPTLVECLLLRGK